MVNHASTTVKLLSLLIASAISVSAFGCEETPPVESVESYTVIENGEPVTRTLPKVESTVYRSSVQELPDDFILSFDNLSAFDGKIIAGGYLYDIEEDTTTDSVAELDITSGEFTVTPLSNGSRAGKTLYNSDGLRAVVTSVVGDMVYESMTLTLYDGGNVEAEYDLAVLFGIDLSRFELSLSGDGIFDIVLLAETDDYFYIVSSTGALRLNPDGSSVKVDSRNEITAASYNGGNLLVISENRGKNQAAYVDFTNLVLGEPFDIPDGTPFMLNGYDTGIFNSSGIYGLFLDETGVAAENFICDFLASDIASQVNAVVSLSENCFYAIMIDLVDHERRLCRLDMLSRDEVSAKKTLTLSMLCDPFSQIVRYAISEFNRTSSEWHIEVSSYISDSEEIFDMDSRDSAEMRFTNDLMAGNIPDLVYISESYFPGVADKLESQGLFADLYSIMDSTGYQRENIIEPVRRAFERTKRLTGEVYLPYLPSYLHISTYIGDRNDFPDGLTLDTALDIIENGESRLVERLTINDFLQFSLNEFIDLDTGETYFNDDTFKRFCEVYRNWGAYSKSFEADGNTDEINDLLERKMGFDIMDLIRPILNGNEDIDIIGYPSPDGGNSKFEVNDILAICEASEYKDAAFGLLELRLSDRYMTSKLSHGVKITQSTFDAEFAEMLRYYGLTAENAISVSSTPPENMDSNRIYHLEDDIVERIKSAYTSAKAVDLMTSDILAIINEELMTFASRPEMTVDEVVGIIDNRVGIYYNERK